MKGLAGLAGTRMEQWSRVEMWCQVIEVSGSDGTRGVGWDKVQWSSKDDGHLGKKFPVSPQAGAREQRNGLMAIRH